MIYDLFIVLHLTTTSLVNNIWMEWILIWYLRHIWHFTKVNSSGGDTCHVLIGYKQIWSKLDCNGCVDIFMIFKFSCHFTISNQSAIPIDIVWNFTFPRNTFFNQFIINRVWSISTYTDFLQYSNRNITRQPLGEVCDACYVYKSLSFDSMSKYVDICKTSLKHIPYIIFFFISEIM